MTRRFDRSLRFESIVGLVLATVLALSCQPGSSLPKDPPASLPSTGETKSTAPPRLLEGLGSQSHPIETQSQLAQRYFDQGLILIFGFNHEAAIRAFEEAARPGHTHPCRPERSQPFAVARYWDRSGVPPRGQLDIRFDANLQVGVAAVAPAAAQTEAVATAGPAHQQ